jgi:hypothetical protein
MKIFIFASALTMLAISVPGVPPTITLTASPLSNGSFQIVASTTPTVQAYYCVFQSTTDFIHWTAISTNTFSFNLAATNIVQTTNTMTFYRVQAVAK